MIIVRRGTPVEKHWSMGSRFNLSYPMPSLGKLLDERDEGDGDGLWDEWSIKENASGLNQAKLTDGFHFVPQSLKNNNFDQNSLKTIGKNLIWCPTSNFFLIYKKFYPLEFFVENTNNIKNWFSYPFELNKNTMFRNI